MPSRRELANAIRALSMDAVQQAKSGHPGAPMGMADIAEVLWNDYLRHNPANPNWTDRDRFVLSNGHGSMLLYSLLHLTGYGLPLEELKNFRQLHSQTPGHPEFGYTPGVETTTGPLGQGLANAVGMAIAERTLAAQFNRDDFDIVDHYTYVFMGDGCLMEGISHEVCSLAGTLKLGKLIGFYDSNNISIDGEIEGWFTDDTVKRFEAYGWHVIGGADGKGIDGHDADAVKKAIEAARAETERPSLIVCRTVIGYGAPNKQGKESSHGAPLGEDEIQLAREQLEWPHPAFEVPAEIYAAWDAQTRGVALESDWTVKYNTWKKSYPELAAEFERRQRGELPENWADTVATYVHTCADKGETIASRKASQNTLDAYGPALTELIGGSADLAGSNNTIWSGSTTNSADTPAGNYLYYGVREFGMTAINNGLALHGGFIPYGGTFLIFSDYARNAIRMSALMKQRNIHVLTHDSIGLGEDGPTHQAVEQAGSLRLIPNLSVWRPCDTVETAVAWQHAIARNDGPTALLLSRQNLAHQPRNEAQLADISRGGYVLVDGDGEPELILIATGSEVQLAADVARQLNDQGRRVRVVSMPCTDLFDAQDSTYREAVLPTSCRQRIAIEAGSADYWYKYVGLDGRVLGMRSFGESAPASDVFEYFGFTETKLIEMVDAFTAN
ncbi:transketolase [Methylohalomonas lacus]|uniref:Transketolase n=1 Tax=Methylohalomonas lacus TaxID=398773 RepID=A0AAE3HNI3_9GAMM|nr:transketolase [Methylohalomonas lacus]MCS3904409.1 transketolase [Methylohalomonas lacus]